MAIAIKCDRCGKYYDKNAYRLKHNNAIPRSIIYANHSNGACSNDIDLCDECFEKLECWLKNEE